jgi:hypothetical protein
MATKIMNGPFLFKRATTNAIDSYVGVEDEVVIDTRETPYRLRVMDGVTPGGIVITSEYVYTPAPIIQYPIDGAIDIVRSPVITASTPTYPNGDSHVASKWEIATDISFNNIAFDSGYDAVNLTGIDIDTKGGVLDLNTTYYVRVKYYAASGSVSNYSPVFSFTTVAVLSLGEAQILTASDGQTGDDFGYAVDMSSDGSILVIGTYLDDDGGSNAGAAYVFEKNGSIWSEAKKLLGSGIVANSRFGNDVAISGDGSTILIGSSRENSYAGKAYIFKKVNDIWTETQVLSASDAGSNDYFGAAVAIDHAGSRIAISAIYDDDSAYNSGAVYMFHYNGSNYTQQTKLMVSDPEANDNLGFSVAISTDGNVVVAGSTRKGVVGNYIGAAYVFTYSGAVWTQQAKLLASDGIAADYFGYSVSTSSNGNVIAIGATGTDDKNSNSGSVYVFEKNGSSWLQTNKLITAIGIDSDQLGKRVSVSGDGTQILATSPYAKDQGVALGAGFLFKKNINWEHVDTLFSSDGLTGDLLGEMAGVISKNGSVIAVSAYRKNNFTGAVYIYN